MANIIEIDLTLKDIDANPDLHNQRAWARRVFDRSGAACRTAMCAGGFTVVRHGYRLVFDVPNVAETEICESPDGDRELIRVVASRILGLDRNEANDFFDGDNTREDLQRMRDNFAAVEEADR